MKIFVIGEEIRAAKPGSSKPCDNSLLLVDGTLAINGPHDIQLSPDGMVGKYNGPGVAQYLMDVPKEYLVHGHNYHEVFTACHFAIKADVEKRIADRTTRAGSLKPEARAEAERKETDMLYGKPMGRDPLPANEGGMTIIHSAAYHGCLDTVPAEMMTEKEILRKDAGGRTTFHHAAGTGSLNVPALRKFLTEERLLEKDDLGYSPLYVAYKRNAFHLIPKGIVNFETQVQRMQEIENSHLTGAAKAAKIEDLGLLRYAEDCAEKGNESAAEFVTTYKIWIQQEIAEREHEITKG